MVKCVVLFRVLYTHSYLCQRGRKEMTAERANRIQRAGGGGGPAKANRKLILH